jgi:hypothetical protein
MSLPLAPRYREVVNVDPPPGMGAAFLANAAKSGAVFLLAQRECDLPSRFR